MARMMRFVHITFFISGGCKKLHQNQEKHHQTMTYEEEYLKFLDGQGIEYDKRFVWLRTLTPLPRLGFILLITPRSGADAPARGVRVNKKIAKASV
jgi:hypothetical protein